MQYICSLPDINNPMQQIAFQDGYPYCHACLGAMKESLENSPSSRVLTVLEKVFHTIDVFIIYTNNILLDVIMLHSN